MRFVRTLAAAAALAFSGQVQAAKVFTISGVATPDSYGYADVRFSPGLPYGGSPFIWAVVAHFSAPVTGSVSLESKDIRFFRFSRDGKRVNAGRAGDSGISGANLTNSRLAHGAGGFPVFHYPNGDWEVFSVSPPTGRLNLSSLSGPVTYSIGIFSAVPEPMTWALMILGFGGVGAAIRNQRASRVRSGYLAERPA